MRLRFPIAAAAAVLPAPTAGALDGMRLSQDDLGILPVQAMYGIEVHSAATAPVKYRVGGCGAIFLWTR